MLTKIFVRTKFLISFIILCTPWYMHSYIGTIYHLYNAQTNQHIFLFGDCHEGKECKSQQDDIIAAASKFNAHIIIEDNFVAFPTKQIADVFFEDIKHSPLMEPYEDLLRNPSGFDPNKDYSNISKRTMRLITRDKESPLYWMTARCHNEKIPVVNVEWRTPLCASINGAAVPSYVAYSIIQGALDEMRHYHDGPTLDIYYQTIIKTCEKLSHSAALRDLCIQDCPLDQAIENIGDQHRIMLSELYTQECWQELVERYGHHINLHDTPIPSDAENNPNTLCQETFLKHAFEIAQKHPMHFLYQYFVFTPTMAILDARILHEIVHLKNQPVIFVCAGLRHVSAVALQLLKNGYSLIKTDTAGKSTLECLEDIKKYKRLDIKTYFGDYYCSKSPASQDFSQQKTQELVKFLAPAANSECLRMIGILPFSRSSCEIEADMAELDGAAALFPCRRIAMMLALKAHAKDLLLEEITKGAKNDCQDTKGKTVLAHAIGLRAWDIVHELINLLPNSQLFIADNKYRTPLMTAAARGCDESMIKALTSRGADINACTPTETTALTSLLKSKYFNIHTLRALLAHGAFPDFPFHSFDNPLYLAVKNGQTEAIPLLCQHGADINHPIVQGMPLLHLTIETSELPIEKTVHTVKTLLSCCADPLLQDIYGKTALDYAFMRAKWDKKDFLDTEHPLVSLLNQWIGKTTH